MPSLFDGTGSEGTGWRRGAYDRVIVFDLDDTLYLERDYVLSGLGAAGAWADVHLGTAGLGAAMQARFRAGARTRIFDDILSQMGMAPDPALIARMLMVYRQHRPDIRLAPDSEAFLAADHPRTGFAVITDGFLDAQKRKIRALDLYRRGIHFGVCTDRWGREGWKPNPIAFRYVQEKFNVPGNLCAYVADNPAKDFHAPHVLGWDTVRISRVGKIGHSTSKDLVEAARVIENLGEF